MDESNRKTYALTDKAQIIVRDDDVYFRRQDEKGYWWLRNITSTDLGQLVLKVHCGEE